MTTKKRLIIELAECGITQKFARQVIESALEEIETALLEEKKVTVKNFGTFELRPYEGRIMNNPRTGEKHRIPDRYVVHFSPAKKFRQDLLEDE